MASYPEELLTYFHNVQHAGELELDPGVVVVESGTPTQEEVVKFFLKLERNTLVTVKFKCYGSVALISACEFVCCWLEGKELSNLDELSVEDILAALALSTVYKHVAVLVLECLKKAKRERK